MAFTHLKLSFLLIAFILLALESNAASLPARVSENEFLIKKWTTADGVPQNTVTSLVQTSDGYIWLGTFGGLARFDGVKFTTFDSTNTAGFRTNRVLSLFEDSHAGLWVGTESGEVYVIRRGVLEEFSSGLNLRREQVWDISEDSLGNMFISSHAGVETFRLDTTGGFVAGPTKIIGQPDSYRNFIDRNGRVWAKLGDRFGLLDGNGVTWAEDMGVELPKDIVDVAFDDKGRVLVTGTKTTNIYDRSKLSSIKLSNGAVLSGGYTTAYFDSHFWLQRENQLVEMTDAGIVQHDLTGYVTQGSRTMLQDNEGNIWLGTETDGLVRLTRKEIGSVAEKLGKELLSARSIVEDHNGEIWIAESSLLRINGSGIAAFNKVSRGKIAPRLQSLAVDAQNRIWVGSGDGLYVFENDLLVPVKSVAEGNIQALYFDRDGTLWVGNERGLGRLRGEEYEVFTVADGLVFDNVHFITQSKDGAIWIGTSRGISRLIDGRFENFTSANGLSAEYVRDIYEDADGTIWLGTYGGGIVRLRNGKFAAITKANGLSNNFVSRMLVDDGWKFWILNNLGVFVVTKDELNRVADGNSSLIGGASFGAPDGMRSSEANGGNQPAGIRASDGRLWFPMISDVVVLDPKKQSNIVPRVAIERASSRTGNEQSTSIPLRFDDGTPIEIENGQRNLEIEYTGLSFTKPEGLRFVYRLDGLDDGWNDAGTRRAAFYPFLPAGNYRFVVRAISSNGVWSENLATVSIRVAERFWETRWFAFLGMLFIMVCVLLIYSTRTRQLKNRQERQTEFSRQLIQASENERERIATDLHDGLSQNLLVIKNWARLGKDSLRRGDSDAEDYVDKINSLAGESLEETRSIIENLGPQNLKRFGLTEAIVNIADHIEDAFGILIETEVTNIDGLLSSDAELSVYRIVQESLNNIVKHSESPRASITIKSDTGFIKIWIRDYGLGFAAPAVNGNPDKTTGGMGIRNIHERVGLMHGKLEIQSVPDEGTTLRIEVPIRDAR